MVRPNRVSLNDIVLIRMRLLSRIRRGAAPRDAQRQAMDPSMYALIPHLHDRIPLTRHTAPYPLACYIPFVYLAYLARRPHTYLLRLSLLPATLCAIVTAAYRFVWTDPSLNVYNWGQCELAVDPCIQI